MAAFLIDNPGAVGVVGGLRPHIRRAEMATAFTRGYRSYVGRKCRAPQPPRLGNPRRGAGRLRTSAGLRGCASLDDRLLSHPGAGNIPLRHRVSDDTDHSGGPAAPYLDWVWSCAQGNRGGPDRILSHSCKYGGRPEVGGPGYGEPDADAGRKPSRHIHESAVSIIAAFFVLRHQDRHDVQRNRRCHW